MRYLLTLALLLTSLAVASAEGTLGTAANPTSATAVTEYFMKQAAQRTLTSTTADQAIFDASRDTATIVSGVYKFDCMLRVESMSATSGNAVIKPLGGGTATITTWNWRVRGIDQTSGSALAAEIAGHMSGANTAASMVTAGIGTGLYGTVQGTFDATVGGTLIPSIGLVTAAAATVEPGTYCHFVRLGATGLTLLGDVN